MGPCTGNDNDFLDAVDGPVCPELLHDRDTRHVFHVDNPPLGQFVPWDIRRRQQGIQPNNASSADQAAPARRVARQVYHCQVRHSLFTYDARLVRRARGRFAKARAETDRQLPPGIIATSGKCLLVSAIGPIKSSNLLCDGGQVKVLVLPGCP